MRDDLEKCQRRRLFGWTNWNKKPWDLYLETLDSSEPGKNPGSMRSATNYDVYDKGLGKARYQAVLETYPT